MGGRVDPGSLNLGPSRARRDRDRPIPVDEREAAARAEFALTAIATWSGTVRADLAAGRIPSAVAASRAVHSHALDLLIVLSTLAGPDAGPDARADPWEARG